MRAPQTRRDRAGGLQVDEPVDRRIALAHGGKIRSSARAGKNAADAGGGEEASFHGRLKRRQSRRIDPRRAVEVAVLT